MKRIRPNAGLDNNSVKPTAREALRARTAADLGRYTDGTTMTMYEVKADRRLPLAANVALGLVMAGVAVFLAMASTAVATSELMLLEWFLSATLVGALAALASGRLGPIVLSRFLVAAAAAIAYFFARLSIALWAGLP